MQSKNINKNQQQTKTKTIPKHIRNKKSMNQKGAYLRNKIKIKNKKTLSKSILPMVTREIKSKAQIMTKSKSTNLNYRRNA